MHNFNLQSNNTAAIKNPHRWSSSMHAFLYEKKKNLLILCVSLSSVTRKMYTDRVLKALVYNEQHD